MPKIKNGKRSDGRLKSAIYLGVTNGKKKYKYVYANNNKELEKKIQEQKDLLGKGIDLTSQNDTFETWTNRYRKLKQTQVSYNRFKTIGYRINTLKPLFDIPIAKINTAYIQDVVLDLAVSGNKGKPYAKKTLIDIKQICSQIFELAISNRIMDYNPATAVFIPRNAETHTKRALTTAEQQWVIDTPHRAQVATMIMMYAGLRRGELIPLQWSDIDLKNGTISVTKSVEMINGKSILKQGGKTDSATRTVYIPSRLVEFLNNFPKKNILVITSASGKMLTASGWRRLWDSYICDLNIKYGNFGNYLIKKIVIDEKTGKPKKYQPKKLPILIPKFTAHWLRHTFITLMYLAGIDVLTAKEQAGHADIKTTLDIYTHLDAEHKIKSISKLDDYLCGSDVGQNKKEM